MLFLQGNTAQEVDLKFLGKRSSVRQREQTYGCQGGRGVGGEMEREVGLADVRYYI